MDALVARRRLRADDAGAHRLYQRRGDWLKAAQMMVRAEAADRRTRWRRCSSCTRPAASTSERLDVELDAARSCSRTSSSSIPEHVEAGEPLAEIYFRDEKWQELEPILDMLARKSEQRDGKRDNKELNQLYLPSGADGRRAQQQRQGAQASTSRPTTSTRPILPTLLGRAALLYKMEDWDGAFKIYQTILVHHRDSQKESEIVDIFYRLGNIKLKQNERKKALNMFEKALELQATHRPTLLVGGASCRRRAATSRRSSTPSARCCRSRRSRRSSSSSTRSAICTRRS